jgi:hypothetical protein
MGALETLHGLAAFERRAGGSDTERRAANWLRDEMNTGNDFDTHIETFWCRPNSALAHAWHVGLGVLGSLLAVASAQVGGVLVLVALLSLLADAFLGVSLGRRLTPERASQNVVSTSRGSDANPGAQSQPATDRRVRLIVTANYDAGRGGLIYRDAPRAAAARVRRLLHGITPGWLGWTAIALVWLEAVALLRVGGAAGPGIGLAQFLPTAGLVLTLAALLDVASADIVPAANDNGSGVAVAIALAKALGAGPPRNAEIEVVLQGASDGTGAGLRHHLRARRKTLQRTNTVVLGLAPSGDGHVTWFGSDGPMVPLRAFGQLRALAAKIGAGDPEMGFAAHRHRGASPALPARLRRLPAISIGSVDDRGLIPRSHQMGDTPAAIDERAMGRVVEAGLLLVDAIDGFLAARAADAKRVPAPQPRP